MKYIQTLSIVVLFLCSCKFEEKDIFPLTPAERINKAMSDNYNALTSATNGWEMAYFANPESSGNIILVKFRTNGMAIMASQSEMTLNQAYEQDSCLFDMIADYGPVLTFNTFNKVLHRYSNPENPDGYGLQGDYEFVFLKSTDEQMVLQGKKYNSIIVFTKLAPTTNWTTYLQAITDFDKQSFSTKSPKLSLSIKNSNYSFTEGYKHVFVMKKDGTSTSTKIPFIVTNQGIRFQNAVEIEGVSFQSFTLNTDKSALVSTENPTYKLAGTDDLALYIINNLKVWNINTDNMSPNLKTAYNNAFDGFKSTYNASDLKLSFTYSVNRVSFILNISYTQGTTKEEGIIDLVMNTSGKDNITFSKKSSGDANGLKFLSDVPAINNLVTLLASGYTLSTQTKLNPLEIKFTKKTDANQWFAVSEKQ